MGIIQQLGINGTAFVQLGIFVFIFTFLTWYVFTPYFHAYEEREKRTKGGEDLAVELQQKAHDLHSEYQVKAKEVSKQIKDIYDAHRSDALKEYDGIVSKARSDAAGLIETNRTKITQSIQAATATLKNETANVASTITQKLLGK